MRRSERPFSAQQALYRLTSDRMDAERLLQLVLIYGRKNPRHPLGEHGLSRARGANHHHAEASGGSDHDAALGDLLTHHVAIIQRHADPRGTPAATRS